MGVSLDRFVELRTIPSRLIHRQDIRPFVLPPAAFPAQDMTSLYAGLKGASLSRFGYGLAVPPIELRLHTVQNGLFFVGHRLDGTVVTEDGHPIHQTAAFRDHHEVGLQDGLTVETSQVRQLGDVFLAFDGAWRNYFHWLCFALAKSFIGNALLDPSVAIVLPDYAPNTDQRPASFSEPVYRQCLSDSGLASRVTLLPPGAYRAERIHLLWTTPGEPTDIMHLDAFTDVFDAIATTVAATAGPSSDPSRIYLARGRGVANRLDDAAARLIDDAAERHGFRKVGFEGLDLREQVAIIAGATHLVSPHGAGLSNMLFNRHGLKVLELNKALDDGPQLRPWFLLAARARGLDYRMLDTGAADFSAASLDAALASFAAAS